MLYALLIVMLEFSHTVLSFLYWNINLPMSFRYLISYDLKAALRMMGAREYGVDSLNSGFSGAWFTHIDQMSPLPTCQPEAGYFLGCELAPFGVIQDSIWWFASPVRFRHHGLTKTSSKVPHNPFYFTVTQCANRKMDLDPDMRRVAGAE